MCAWDVSSKRFSYYWKKKKHTHSMNHKNIKILFVCTTLGTEFCEEIFAQRTVWPFRWRKNDSNISWTNILERTGWPHPPPEPLLEHITATDRNIVSITFFYCTYRVWLSVTVSRVCVCANKTSYPSRTRVCLVFLWLRYDRILCVCFFFTAEHYLSAFVCDENIWVFKTIENRLKT